VAYYHTYYPSYLGGLEFKASPGKKLARLPSQNKQVWWCMSNPRYVGGIGSRIQVQGQLAQNVRPYQNKNKKQNNLNQKGWGCGAQMVECPEFRPQYCLRRGKK
jgi:hypothetical protein